LAMSIAGIQARGMMRMRHLAKSSPSWRSERAFSGSVSSEETDCARSFACSGGAALLKVGASETIPARIAQQKK